jgi:hypothetical protein
MLGLGKCRARSLVMAALAVRDVPRRWRRRGLREGVTASKQGTGPRERRNEEESTHQ